MNDHDDNSNKNERRRKELEEKQELQSASRIRMASIDEQQQGSQCSRNHHQNQNHHDQQHHHHQQQQHQQQNHHDDLERKIRKQRIEQFIRQDKNRELLEEESEEEQQQLLSGFGMSSSARNSNSTSSCSRNSNNTELLRPPNLARQMSFRSVNPLLFQSIVETYKQQQSVLDFEGSKSSFYSDQIPLNEIDDEYYGSDNNNNIINKNDRLKDGKKSNNNEVITRHQHENKNNNNHYNNNKNNINDTNHSIMSFSMGSRNSTRSARSSRRISIMPEFRTSLGRRSETTSLRLQLQGYESQHSTTFGSHHTISDSLTGRLVRKTTSTSTSILTTTNQQHNHDFAVRSIERDCDDWHTLLKPFVSDLACKSICPRRYSSKKSSSSSSSSSIITSHDTTNTRYSRKTGSNNNNGANSNNNNRFELSELRSGEKNYTYQTYTCQAAILFVDLSGYSRITSAVAHRGAHMISAVVNAYLERLIKIIYAHGGDVIKFAGDAIMAVWDGNEQELELNVLCAARCSVELQTSAGEHHVEGTEHKFRIHIGLSCGTLESELFEAPVSTNVMQKLYHSVGGECMNEIANLVDLAEPGEVAVSRNCLHFLELNDGIYEDIDEDDADGAKLLSIFEVTDDLIDIMDKHIDAKIDERYSIRRQMKNIEEDFIHNSVLDKLNHGGLSPTQIAEMRYLCVLFISMTSKGSSVNWLMEVQEILDKNRCPIVQIIDDDKGVHLVAAVNLYEALPETEVIGLGVCRALQEKRVGASVGAAIGQTFCGVTGSNLACRWDITGYAVVRAARLMQYAISKKIDFALDESIYEDPMAATQMTLIDSAVYLKGTDDPIAIYGLSDARYDCSFRILENTHGGIHNSIVQEIQNHIGARNRSAIVVTGMSLAGKKIACQRAAGFSGLVTYRHLCQKSAGFLQLGRTIATWFQYNEDKALKQLADSVLDDMNHGRWTCAHDHCVSLLEDALKKGCKVCFVVDRVQHLDRFSLSLIRECLRPKDETVDNDKKGGDGKVVSRRISFSNAWNEHDLPGTVCFLCVHVPSYNSKSAEEIVDDIVRSHASFKIPIMHIGEATREELRTLMLEAFDVEVDERWLDAYSEASGRCAGYFIERFVAIQHLSLALQKFDKQALMEVSEDLVLRIPPNLVRLNKEVTVTQLRPEIAMRFSQIYDELPPLCQMIIKILAIAGRKSFYYKLPRQMLWEVINDLIAKGVDRESLEMLLDEMVDICLIRMDISDDGGEDMFVLTIQTPALANIAMDVCTPVQVESIAKALIKRIGKDSKGNFEAPLVVASLRQLLRQNDDSVKDLFFQAYSGFVKRKTAEKWSTSKSHRWIELIFDEIRAAGYEPRDVVGEDEEANFEIQQHVTIPKSVLMLSFYRAPVSLGPMGHTLSAISRYTFQEYGEIHGPSSSGENDFTNQSSRSARNLSSACTRYIMEMNVLEEFMNNHDCGARLEEMEQEFDMISFMYSTSTSGSDVETKAMIFCDEIIPRFIERRLQRLYKLIHALKQDKLPDIMRVAPKPIRIAYVALQSRTKNRNDAAQDALMIMATLNWTPKQIPEFLPFSYYQTVTSIRNETLKRDSAGEAVMYRHQQTIDDLEAFLIVTALLNSASDQGLC